MFPQVLIAAADASAATTPTTLLGALIIGLTTLAGVCGYLFVRYDKRNDQIAEERKAMHVERDAWNVEKERLRTENESRMREQSERLARELTEVVKTAREAENTARREFGVMLDSMAERNDKGTDALVKTLEKLTDRLTTLRERGRYGG